MFATDIETHNALALFAATPPNESLKYLLRRAAQKHENHNMHLDGIRAYFYAQASSEIYAKLPVEDMGPGDEDQCGKLPEQVYGRRDAAQSWQRKCSETVRELGVVKGKASPCHFYQDHWGVCCIVLCDDFALAGGKQHLEAIA